uniref:Uncharacterized protein n=1 Tax=viral metagenome TaxID=1070528 RepID=A0A6C0BP14_9ZZZZ
MPVIVMNDQSDIKNVSNISVVADVFIIFILGLFLLVLMTTYTNNIRLFVLSLAVYFIGMNIYILLYITSINDNKIKKTLKHRILNFMGIYNIFLGMFLIILSFMYSS